VVVDQSRFGGWEIEMLVKVAGDALTTCKFDMAWASNLHGALGCSRPGSEIDLSMSCT
jgi:hypothetical protein